ncbi:MAG: hypothetical protein U0640_07680 [Phycisphaerales bacterium]
MKQFLSVATCFALAGLACADLVISDAVMSDVHWTVTKYFDTTPNGTATGSSSQLLTGGQITPECRQTRHIWQIVPTGVSIGFFHARNDAVWNPSVMGGIDFVFTSIHYRCISAPHVNAIGVGMMIEQGGSYYYCVQTASTAFVNDPWFDCGFVPTTSFDWVKAAGPGPVNPDFSSNGAPLHFGFYSSNGGSGVSLLNTAILYTDAYELSVVGSIHCNDIDFNNDFSVFDPQDIDAFLSVYGEGDCIPTTATCDSIDFNNDTSVFDPCDIDSFLTVFGEGPCTLCGI